MGDQFGQIAGRLSRLEDDTNRLKAQDRPLPFYDPGFPAFYSFIKDDFIVSNAGTFGELVWNNVGNSAAVLDVAGRPGVVNKSTGAATGTFSYICPRALAFQPMNASENFDVLWMVRLNTNDANTAVQIGLSRNPAIINPNDGAYIEKQAADTSWFGVNRAGGVQTRTAAMASVTTNWVKFRIRRIDASTIGFTVDTNTEVTLTTNVPTTTVQPCVSISNTANADKNIDIDYFHLLIFGLSR